MLREAVEKAVEVAPCSERALAQAAGLAQSTVWRIRTGERPCHPRHLEALADGLADWIQRCQQAEAVLRRALEEEEGGQGA